MKFYFRDFTIVASPQLPLQQQFKLICLLLPLAEKFLIVLIYRRSYRKTAQLNDFRFASGFGADARRKRHTADSGYGSEQPLDRRWSQEFNQEVSGKYRLRFR